MTHNFIKYFGLILYLTTLVSCSLKDSYQKRYNEVKQTNDFCEYLNFAYYHQDTDLCDSACLYMFKRLHNQDIELVVTPGDLDTNTGKFNLNFNQEFHNDPEPPLKSNNTLTLTISKTTEFSFWGGKMNLSDIDSLVKDFLINPENSPNFSEKILIEIDQIGMIEKTLGYITIQCDYLQHHSSKSDWMNLFESISTIYKVYSEIWNESSTDIWNRVYDNLEVEEKKGIQKISPFKLKIRFYDRIDNIPPPPTKEDLKHIIIIDDE